MGKPLSSAELLRNRVKSAVTDRGQRRALMRAMGLKSQGTITQWLDYEEHNPSVDKLDAIALFLKCQVSDLFADDTTVGLSGVTAPVHGPALHSHVKARQTGGANEPPASDLVSALQQHLRNVQARYDTLRAAVVGGVKSFGNLVAEQDAQVAREESASRQDDRRPDRQLLRERKRQR